ncbi:hypothetical protein FsymDg_3260 [Candidatus Protofrankia datiscae]|uniref:Uncharacterized protein n=1 Tax=Candidatus Protofrankia datiscae TaxID=2716812 RepID=F8AZ89_9ACTN|nr:hypothetical protein FsymDg_3260 [Candidatus Protofrankia datiscae]
MSMTRRKSVTGPKTPSAGQAEPISVLRADEESSASPEPAGSHAAAKTVDDTGVPPLPEPVGHRRPGTEPPGHLPPLPAGTEPPDHTSNRARNRYGYGPNPPIGR